MTDKWDLVIRGCDDTTRLFDLDLTPEVAAELDRIAELSRSASTSSCMPTLTLSRSPGPPPIGAECTECWGSIMAPDAGARDRYGEWVHKACEVPT